MLLSGLNLKPLFKKWVNPNHGLGIDFIIIKMVCKIKLFKIGLWKYKPDLYPSECRAAKSTPQIFQEKGACHPYTVIKIEAPLSINDCSSIVSLLS